MAEQAKTTEAGAKLSNADIAATLLNVPKPTSTPEPEEEEVEAVSSDADEQDDVDADETGDEDSPTGGEDDEESRDLEASEDESDDEAEEEEEGDEGKDEAEYFDISDEDLLSVTVDGEEHEVSIGDLKRTFSGEGAIEKRLQEATEMRKKAHSEATQIMQRLAQDQHLLETALDGLDDSVFTEVIPPPPAELKQKDPARYLRHQEAYQQDQQRIANGKKAMEEALEKAKKAREERLQEYAQHAGEVLSREIPELADPQKSQSMFNAMAQTAASYGYTEQEINNALDPRMFMLVRDAMRYRELTSKAKETDPTTLKGKRGNKVRRLRSGNTRAENVVRQRDKQRQAATKRARKTGKVEDVAATLLAPAKR